MGGPRPARVGYAAQGDRPIDPRIPQTIGHTLARQGIAKTANPSETIRGTPLATAAEQDHSPATPAAPPEDLSANLDAHRAAVADLKLGDTLATGGMGWIRAGYQRSLQREVAIKSLRPDKGDPAAIVREAQLTGRLEHPNIVPIHGLAWSEEEGPLVVMKRIEGESWYARIVADEETFDWHIHVLMDVCRAVHFAHSRGYLHRDLKPANVMVGAHGEVYLLDWGVAAPLGTRTQGTIHGTPAYMAPEQVGDGPLDARTDVFLLGACLHLLLTRQARNPGATVQEALCQAADPEPYEYGPAIDPELAAIAASACAADPDDRFPTAHALREALERYLEHRASVDATQRARLELSRLEREVREFDHSLAANVALHERFGLVRFGFEQALREWPANETARQGLHRALHTMARFELDAGDHATASALLAPLDDASPELLERIKAAQQDAAARARAGDALQALRREARFSGQDWGRSITTLLNAGFVAAFLLYGAHFQAQGHTITLASNTLAVLAGTALFACGVYVFRDYLLDSLQYRRVIELLGALLPLLLFNRLLASPLHLDFTQLLAMDLATVTALSTALAIFTYPIFWVTAVASFLGAALAMWNVAHALEIIATLYVAHHLWLAWLLRPTRRSDPAQPS